MLNYGNLNDVEFEALCRDVMERKLGVSLRRFASGQDGGIDLTEDVVRKEIVVQVKHYQKSDIQTLVRGLKREKAKVEGLAPGQYYICCSRELSPEKIRELYVHFQDYMASDRNIITLLEIDDFLKEPQNQDILEKHFKLWLDNTGILKRLQDDRLFVDCEVLLSDLQELQRLFVPTSAFDQAVKRLKKHRVLCIVGNPGVGKTITSKMLLLRYAAQGYRVRYTSDVTELTTLKASLRRDPEEKEVILLDDCFGQAYFEMKYSQANELISLIRYVKAHPGKVLILNSRVTIFQEAKARQRELVKSLEREELRLFVLDMSALPKVERAKILYNHLTFCGLPEEYLQDLKLGNRYRNLVRHKNFSPRIIEFVCDDRHYRDVKPEQFYGFVKKHLDNPQQIWKEEYEQRLQQVDRILLQTLYALTSHWAKLETVRRCFERRIAGMPLIDKTADPFGNSLGRLTEGFVNILDIRGERYLSMVNPSVNDFLDGRMAANPLERQELLDSISAPGQLRLLPESQWAAWGTRVLETGAVDQYIFQDSQERQEFVAACILRGRVQAAAYRQELLAVLGRSGIRQLRLSSPLYRHYFEVMENILLPEIWEFYGLKEFFLQPDCVYRFLSGFHLQDGVGYIHGWDGYFTREEREPYIEQVLEYLKEAIEEYCQVEAESMLTTLDIERAVYSATDEDVVDVDEVVASLEEDIANNVADRLYQMLEGLPEPFARMADQYDSSDVSVGDVEGAVEEYLSEAEEDDPQNTPAFSLAEETAAIDAIFLR